MIYRAPGTGPKGQNMAIFWTENFRSIWPLTLEVSMRTPLILHRQGREGVYPSKTLEHDPPTPTAGLSPTLLFPPVPLALPCPFLPKFPFL